MKEIFKQLGIFALAVLKKLDWKTVVYKALMGTMLPMLEQKAKDSTSKIDDVIVAGLRQLIVKFLGPDEDVKLLVEAPPKS